MIDPTAPAKGSCTEWLSRLWYRIGYFVTAFLFLFAYSLRIFGKKNVPQRGGLLVISNHQSYLDPPMVGLALWRPIHYVARRTLFRSRLFALLIHSFGAVPIDQNTSGADGIKRALRLLRAGKAVLLFPEGARTPDGRIQPLKPGIVALLRRAKAPVLPVGIAGAFDVWPIHQPVPRLAPLIRSDRSGIVLVVGKPIDSATLRHFLPHQIITVLQQELQKVQGQAEALRRQAMSRQRIGITSASFPRR